MRSDRYDNPAADPEAEPFLKSVAASPGDQLPRLVFADWLEENGYHNAAHGQRWAAKYGKYPYPSRPDDAGGPFVSGWFGVTPENGFPALLKNSHIDPAFFRYMGARAAGKLMSSHWDKPHSERPYHHEAAFLEAAHRTEYDANGEPVPLETWNK